MIPVKILLLLTISFHAGNSFAQKLKWSGHNSSDHGGVQTFDLTIDGMNNIISVGEFAGDRVDLDPGPGQSFYGRTTDTGPKFYIQKLDSLGNLIWVNAYIPDLDTRHYAYEVLIDKDNNIYVAGRSEGILDFDLSNDSAFIENWDSTNFSYLLKINSNGDFIFVKEIPGYINSMELRNSSEILIAMWLDTVGDFDPDTGTHLLGPLTGKPNAFIQILDTGGHFVDAFQLESTGSSYISNLTFDSQSNTYIIGQFRDSIDADPGTGVFSYFSKNTSGFIIKTDDENNFIWSKQFVSTRTCTPKDIALIEDNHLVIAGDFRDSLDMDLGPNFDWKYSNSHDIFIYNFDSAGNGLWHWESDTPANWQFGTSNIAVNSKKQMVIAATNDLLLKFSSSGDQSKYLSFNHPSGTMTNTGNLSFNTKNNLISSFMFNNEIDVDPGPKEKLYNKGSSGWDTFIAEYGECAKIGLACSEINDTLFVPNIFYSYQWIKCDSAFTIINGDTSHLFSPNLPGSYAVAYMDSFGCVDTSLCYNYSFNYIKNDKVEYGVSIQPNPTSNSFKINWTGESKNCDVTIYNSIGNLIHRRGFRNGESYSFSTSLPSGLYILTAENYEFKQTIKLIIE